VSLGWQAHVVEHYLNSYVFPETMEHQVYSILYIHIDR
jgi:hypothetical protein